MKVFFPYLKLLLTALEKLPNIEKMVGMGWGREGEGRSAAVLFSSSTGQRLTLTQILCYPLRDLTLLVYPLILSLSLRSPPPGVSWVEGKR